MSASMEITPNVAVFCDFENVAIGAREARYDHLDIELILARLLDKGKVVVKKAYADWDRYKPAKRGMHEASFEMIEVPHVSYSGKNSADIRMVVDALDLCYTKPHIDVFAIVSGDSDFSPLVSKLRENNKQVIGVGVKNSSSDLLIENCDEFIYYDDLVRKRGKKKSGRRGRVRDEKVRDEKVRDEVRPEARPVRNGDKPAKSEPRIAARAEPKSEPRSEPKSELRAEPRSEPKSDPGIDPGAKKKDELEEDGPELEQRRLSGLDHVLETVEALFEDRDGNLWGSMIKQTLKRKRPNFSERFHGYRSFSHMLEDAEKRGLLELNRDDRSGGYVITGFGPNA